ncbi:transforming growth factor beta-1-induced transcript 1 protein isoform X3 [Protopterus annectens]|uniref:transforming growth factor beta-1-induced transcript 1 protein isoform X3 n=1 Tax=Protopterus annectens TaxID=7888 RepID=UPI001CFB6F90|nr:transforming growth factor beta-1-induced transcript 1 protein isoform X3 [Protopterus annectens]
MDDLGDVDIPYCPLGPRIVSFDALLADLENTTAHISKRPVLISEAAGTKLPDVALQAHTNGITRDIPEPRPPPPAYTPQQTVPPVVTGESIPKVSNVTGDKDHLYSTVCKPKSPKPKEQQQPPFSSTSVLGGGLCELDRLLQELNATQFNIADEIMAQFPPKKEGDADKNKESPGTGRKYGQSLPPRTSDENTAAISSSSQAPPKPSATFATQELDKLMASLYDFKVQSNLTMIPDTSATVRSQAAASPVEQLGLKPSCILSADGHKSLVSGSNHPQPSNKKSAASLSSTNADTDVVPIAAVRTTGTHVIKMDGSDLLHTLKPINPVKPHLFPCTEAVAPSIVNLQNVALDHVDSSVLDSNKGRHLEVGKGTYAFKKVNYQKMSTNGQQAFSDVPEVPLKHVQRICTSSQASYSMLCAVSHDFFECWVFEKTS